MSITITQIKTLPELVQDVMGLEVCNEVNERLFERYRLTEAERHQLIEVMNELFVRQLSVEQFQSALKEIRTEPSFINDILGERFLILDGYFEGAISAALARNGADQAQYQDEIQRQRAGIEAYHREQRAATVPYQPPVQADEAADQEVVIDVNEEKKQSLELFSQRLVDVLRANSEEMQEIIATYNASLLNVLAEEKDRSFVRKLVRALQGNAEQLTQQPFALKGQPAAPTIANWLRDFISAVGADYIDSVAVSRYLSNSKNVVPLPPAEQKLVRKLLQLYRNLAFFPRSMPNQTGEGWEIIPVERTVKPKVATKPQAAVRPQPQPTAPAARLPRPGRVTPPRVAAAPDERATLEALAAQYPAGSLERRAIEEELSKLQS